MKYITCWTNRARNLVLPLLLITTCVAKAGTFEINYGSPPPETVIGEDLYLFKSGEVFVDLYGVIVGGTDFEPDFSGGGGVGAGFFFNRYFGVMGEVYLLDFPDHEGSVTGGIVARLPVDDFCTAFYGMALVGAEFSDETRISLQFGGGLDIRMTDHVSVFSDARGVFTSSSKLDTAWLVRGGIRLVF